MRILHLSDTHGFHRRLKQLPEADVLVHSGDFCMAGTDHEAEDFCEWLSRLPYRHKVFIAGNHDEPLYEAPLGVLPENVHYLCNSGIEIEGVRFYGVPMFVMDCFSGLQTRHYTRIPYDTDILVSHNPPYGILDLDGSRHYGDKKLLERVGKVQPRLHLFGHLHSGNGIHDQNGTLFSNASIVDAGYNMTFQPRLLTI